MNNQKPIFDLHAEHTKWLNKLSFYQDEISVMQNRINEIATKNTSNDVLAMVEHFQNQIYIQTKRISDIKHIIKKDEEIIEASVFNNNVATDHRKVTDNAAHREQMERFESIFTELKNELNGFLSRTM